MSSIARAIRPESQYTSEPTCSTGVRRYPPVSATTSGLGITAGMITDFHLSPLKPRIARIFSA